MKENHRNIRGSGGPPPPPPPRQPTRTPDTLHSKQFATFLDLISEGEIEGFEPPPNEPRIIFLLSVIPVPVQYQLKNLLQQNQ